MDLVVEIIQELLDGDGWESVITLVLVSLGVVKGGQVGGKKVKAKVATKVHQREAAKPAFTPAQHEHLAANYATRTKLSQLADDTADHYRELSQDIDKLKQQRQQVAPVDMPHVTTTTNTNESVTTRTATAATGGLPKVNIEQYAQYAPALPGVKDGRPVGIRLCNPTALKHRSHDPIPWTGLATPSWDYGAKKRQFSRFENALWGVRAGARNIITKVERDGLNTPNKLIHVWAPKDDDNDPDSYAAAVAKHLGSGIGVDTEMNVRNQHLLAALCRAIATHECGSLVLEVWPDTIWLDGARLALGIATPD